MRFRLFLALGVSGVVAALVACVGDSSAVAIVNNGTDAGTDSGTGSTTTNPTTTDDGGSTPANDSGTSTGTDSGVDAGPTLCQTYCKSFGDNCQFDPTVTDSSYPSNDVCVAMCTLVQPTGDSADSIACRTKYLASGAVDCAAAGPWGVDFDKEPAPICGPTQPCASICNVLVPRCKAAGSSMDATSCSNSCDTALNGPSANRDCMEKAALDAYVASGNNAIQDACAAYTACANNQ